MANLNPQNCFNSRTVKELEALLWEVSRLYEKFRQLVEHLQDEKSTQSKPLPCDNCIQREKCPISCKLLEERLSRPYAGKIHGEGTINLSLGEVKNTTGFCDDLEEENVKKFDQSTIKSIQKVSSINVFAEYEACWSIFSIKQHEVVSL
jgi:hypothetical protein